MRSDDGAVRNISPPEILLGRFWRRSPGNLAQSRIDGLLVGENVVVTRTTRFGGTWYAIGWVRPACCAGG
jgi:hypothetical protein